MLLDHFDGILNYCETKVALGVVEAINGNIKTLLRRGRGYKNLTLPAAEGAAFGRHQSRIRRLRESRMNREARQFLAQSRFLGWEKYLARLSYKCEGVPEN